MFKKSYWLFSMLMSVICFVVCVAIFIGGHVFYSDLIIASSCFAMAGALSVVARYLEKPMVYDTRHVDDEEEDEDGCYIYEEDDLK